MITPAQLADSFALNLRLIRMQADGLTHAESLTQSPYNINCLNWVIGHILVGRDSVLGLLGELPVLTEEERSVYRSGSSTLREDGPGVIPLERQLDLLALGQELISAGLARLSAEDLQRPTQAGERTVPLGERLFGFYFHDTYHTGQTDLLRQVAGKNDKVI